MTKMHKWVKLKSKIKDGILFMAAFVACLAAILFGGRT